MQYLLSVLSENKLYKTSKLYILSKLKCTTVWC